MSTETVKVALATAMIEQARNYWEVRYRVGMRLAFLRLLEQRKAKR